MSTLETEAETTPQVLVTRHLRVDAIEAQCDIVDGISLALSRGETLGIVGESGSGKTTVAVALLGVARPGTRLAAGQVVIADIDLVHASERVRAKLRGHRVAYVPQSPATALSPGRRIGNQLSEVVETHLRGESDVVARVRRAFAAAQLPSDDTFLRRYPHELSGGQQQRVCIAMALVCDPDIVVMDEPTTGLDVTTQARLLQEIRELAARLHTSIVYISHDLAVVRNIADRVMVLYGGRIVEQAPVDELFQRPRHPYTRRLLEAIPRIDVDAVRPRGIPGSAVEPWNRPAGCPFAARCDFVVPACEVELPPVETDGTHAVRCIRWREAVATPPVVEKLVAAQRGVAGTEVLLAIDDLRAGYGRRLQFDDDEQLAVRGVSISVRKGACLGIVGESGSGKTTLLRCVSGLHERQEGGLLLDGMPIPARARKRSLEARRRIQLVPQNPDASLNPTQRIGEIVGRPLTQFFRLRGAERDRRVGELLDRVRLRAAFAHRMPRELSGGEKQRVAIARALAAEPDLLLCDEVTSALDVAVQAGILTLLDELRAQLGTTLLFVSHDLAVVRSISDEVVVMREGTVREARPTRELFDDPRDSYTRELLAAVPRLRTGDYPGTGTE